MGVEVMFLQTHYTQLDKFAGRQITAGKKVASPTAVNAIRKLEERFHKVVKDNNLKEVDLITQLPEDPEDEVEHQHAYFSAVSFSTAVNKLFALHDAQVPEDLQDNQLTPFDYVMEEADRHVRLLEEQGSQLTIREFLQ